MRYIHPLLFGLEYLAYQLSDCTFFMSKSELTDATRLFHLNQKRCFFVPHIARRQSLLTTQEIVSNKIFTIIFFGDFSYTPNVKGLKALLENIIPLLDKRVNFDCRVIIFGKNMPRFTVTPTTTKHIPVEFYGFISDPTEYIRTADVMINPVCAGAGVQTKIINALSLGTTVVSAQSGSRGIEKDVCGEKLAIVLDDDWDGYVSTLIKIKNSNQHLNATPESFFDVYSEKSVMKTVNLAIQSL